MSDEKKKKEEAAANEAFAKLQEDFSWRQGRRFFLQALLAEDTTKRFTPTDDVATYCNQNGITNPNTARLLSGYASPALSEAERRNSLQQQLAQLEKDTAELNAKLAEFKKQHASSLAASKNGAFDKLETNIVNEGYALIKAKRSLKSQYDLQAAEEEIAGKWPIWKKALAAILSVLALAALFFTGVGLLAGAGALALTLGALVGAGLAYIGFRNRETTWGKALLAVGCVIMAACGASFIPGLAGVTSALTTGGSAVVSAPGALGSAMGASGAGAQFAGMAVIGGGSAAVYGAYKGVNHVIDTRVDTRVKAAVKSTQNELQSVKKEAESAQQMNNQLANQNTQLQAQVKSLEDRVAKQDKQIQELTDRLEHPLAHASVPPIQVGTPPPSFDASAL